ncbi:hypothetical protein DMENIID0001_108660 [Sergentomyia squamirostris]
MTEPEVTEVSAAVAEDDIIPEDFFDDFSNTEFMAGLDVIDAWDEGEDKRSKKSSTKVSEAKTNRSDKVAAGQKEGDNGKSSEGSGEKKRRHDSQRSTSPRRRDRESPDRGGEKRRRYSPPYSGRRYLRTPPWRRGGRHSRSKSRSRSRSPRGRRRSPISKKTPFLEELAQKLAEKGHSLTGLQPNPFAFQAQNYPNYPGPGYSYPVRSPAPPMIMPYQQMPLVTYPNLAYQAPTGPDGYGSGWPGQPPSNFTSSLNINLTQTASATNAPTTVIPGTNPEPPKEAVAPEDAQRKKFHLGLAQMLEDNYVEVKEKIAELTSKDTVLVRCKKAIDALRGDSKASSAFIFVPMTVSKEVNDGSPVGKFHHVRFPWTGVTKNTFDNHFLTLSSLRNCEIAQKLGVSASRIINKMKVHDVTEKITQNSNSSNYTSADIALMPTYATTAIQTEGFECMQCLERDTRTFWDAACQTQPLPPTPPSVQEILPDYDEMAINLLRQFGPQQRDILLYFMRLIERPSYVTPYHVNTLTSRLQNLHKDMYVQVHQFPDPGYIVGGTPLINNVQRSFR